MTASRRQFLRGLLVTMGMAVAPLGVVKGATRRDEEEQEPFAVTFEVPVLMSGEDRSGHWESHDFQISAEGVIALMEGGWVEGMID